MNANELMLPKARRVLKELCNQADEIDSKAYAALCEEAKTDKDFVVGLLAIVSETA